MSAKEAARREEAAKMRSVLEQEAAKHNELPSSGALAARKKAGLTVSTGDALVPGGGMRSLLQPEARWAHTIDSGWIFSRL